MHSFLRVFSMLSLVSLVYMVENSQKTTQLKVVSTTPFSNSTPTPTTELPTTCGGNSTCNFTTILTTVKPKVTTTSKPKENNTQKISWEENKKYDGKNICTCNLKRKICDINCCCDPDCTPNNKKVFGYCEPEPDVFYDTRYCNYMQYIYINNTQYEWQVNQNGLFCIIRNNLPASYTVQNKHPFKSFKDAKKAKELKPTWFEHEIKILESRFNNSKQFIFGQPIWLVDSKNNIKVMKLPNRLVSNKCLIKEDVLALSDFDSKKCVQTDISEDNKEIFLGSYFQNFLVITSPHLFNMSSYKNNPFKNCPKNVCIPIETKICEKNFEKCVPPKNYTVKCSFNILKNENTCLNVVKAMKYKFYHNGTTGIKKVELLAILDNITFEFGAENLIQEFTVSFVWINKTMHYSRLLSGNPGYIVGKPILVGQIVNVGNKTKKILKVWRNPTDYTGNFLVFPENVYSSCVLNKHKYLPIEFGYNMLARCNHKIYVENKKLNASDICRNFQKSIWKNWNLVVDQNRTVGMFGNADSGDVDEWTEILYEKHPKIFLNETFGNFSNGNKSVNCYNISTKLSIDIFHSRVDFKNLLNQEKILGVAVSFEHFLDVSILLESTTELVLTSHVMFYDVTSRKHKKFVEAPSFKIRLPHDFFYPFIKVDNAGIGLSLHKMSFGVAIFVFVFNL